eukprot:scaffold33958_cov136-Isochrysis_galbana.AAC.1
MASASAIIAEHTSGGSTASVVTCTRSRVPNGSLFGLSSESLRTERATVPTAVAAAAHVIDGQAARPASHSRSCSAVLRAS